MDASRHLVIGKIDGDGLHVADIVDGVFGEYCHQGCLANEFQQGVDFVKLDTDFEVVLTSRGYTVMGFDNHRQDWNTVDFCPTPEALRDSLLNAYESFRELEITGGDRDLTEKEEAKLAKERDALTALCEKEAAKCSS